MTARRITAAAPLSTLVHALARVSWGPLAGAANRPARIVLEVLAGQARHCQLDAAGEMVITAKQIADWAGYSERHVRRWLPILEGLGLIAWKRGHIEAGKPVPGVMRVNKRVIAQWVRDYTAKNDARLEERKAQTVKRLELLRKERIALRIPPVVPRWKKRADMMTSLPPSYEGRAGGQVPRPLPTAGDSTPKQTNNATPKGLEMPYHDYMPDTCKHRADGTGDPWYCNSCRFAAMRAEQEALNEQRRAQAAAAIEAEREEQRRQDRWQAYMDKTYPGTSHIDKARIMQARTDATALAILAGTA